MWHGGFRVCRGGGARSVTIALATALSVAGGPLRGVIGARPTGAKPVASAAPQATPTIQAAWKLTIPDDEYVSRGCVATLTADLNPDGGGEARTLSADRGLPTTFIVSETRGSVARCNASLRALNSDGTMAWRAAVCTADSTSLALDPRSQATIHVHHRGTSCVVVVVGFGSTSDAAGQVQALSCDSGAVLWNRTDLAYSYGSPPGAFDDNLGVYYVLTQPNPDTYARFRVAFDVHANTALWNVSTRGEPSGQTSSSSQPILGSPTTIAWVEIDVFVLTSSRTGKVIANYSIPYLPQGWRYSAVCGQDTLLLLFETKQLWTIDMRTGSVLWKSGVEASPRTYLFPATTSALTPTGAPPLFVVARQDGTEAYPCRWDNPVSSVWPKPTWSNLRAKMTGPRRQQFPVMLPSPDGSTGGVVVVKINDYNVTVLNLETGATLFEYLFISTGGLNALNVQLAMVGSGLSAATALKKTVALQGPVNIWNGIPWSGQDIVATAMWDAASGRLVGAGDPEPDTDIYVTQVWPGAYAGSAVYQSGNVFTLARAPSGNVDNLPVATAATVRSSEGL